MKFAIISALLLAACGVATRQGDILPAQYEGRDCNAITLGLTATAVGDTNATIRCQVTSQGSYYWYVVSQDVVGN